MVISDLIADALRDLNVLNEVESPSSEQGAHGLRVLNQMLELWEEEGVKIQWFAQTDITQDYPCPAYTESGVTAHLSIRLAPTYGITVSPELIAKADAGYSVILRKAINAKLKSVDMSNLPQGEGHGIVSNILTGY